MLYAARKRLMQCADLIRKMFVEVCYLRFKSLIVIENLVYLLDVMQQQANRFVGALQAFLRVLGQLSNLLCYYGEASSCFAGTCGFYRSIKCEQVNLGGCAFVLARELEEDISLMICMISSIFCVLSFRAPSFGMISWL